MVQPVALPAINPDDPDEPPHSGYSPRHDHDHALAHHAAPPAAAPPAGELSAPTLTSRLLDAIAPATAARHRPTGPSGGASVVRSSSLPNLDRAHRGGTASPALADDQDSLREKLPRTATCASAATVDGTRTWSAEPTCIAPLAGSRDIAAPQDDQPQRPVFLSKALLEPKKPIGKNPSFRQCCINVARYSWLNVLLVFVPVSWAMDLSHQSATITFVMSFLAIVPLAALLGYATEELAIRVGDALGGLLNATFGNAVELIIAILALTKGELGIVRSSMLGSILSNCLLVLGCCFAAGGFKFYEQGYSIRAAQLNINLLGIAVVAIVIPVGFHAFINQNAVQSEALTDDAVLRLSRGIAFILLIVYDLLFQLWTHSYLYVPAPPRDPRKPLMTYAEGPFPPVEGKVFRIPSLPSWGSSSSSSASNRSVRSRASSFVHGDQPIPANLSMAEEGLTRTRSSGAASSTAGHHVPPEPREGAFVPNAGELEAQAAAAIGGFSTREQRDLEKGGEAHGSDSLEHQPELSPWFGFVLLAVVTALTGVTAEFLVSSIDGLTQTGNVSKEFVALILLPVVGNAAEHVTAVTVATKNKLDLSLSIAVGSSIQVALFIVPVLILLGWAIGQPLDLEFDSYETLVVFVSIWAVNCAIGDGRTNWLEGVSLMFVYVIIALVTWYYPGTQV
ncbi:hypothetical protein Rhopal_003456-T1 [Rhodotorula paludigena]|uniref:Sodium/calcium exchanger membrane region domain-containing protein n=1 Tax=Rhodotorula paludigena TaxID=86838 RepID=A0AAV5GKR7_9BASI|nr:hypothetical protein Rhopal_003456-T1 [Rhodotorula paludigena]